jgi:taurine dioxygenase
MQAAFEGLSKPCSRSSPGSTRCTTSRAASGARHGREGRGSGQAREGVEEHPPVVHPVIRTHPETGADGIFVNFGFTSKIVGLRRKESDALLNFLFEHVTKPEYLVRWKWRPNSIAFWDNRVTQHYAVNDYLPQRRVMHRATVLGDRPFHRSRRANQAQ